jgi:hypothetical protein
MKKTPQDYQAHLKRLGTVLEELTKNTTSIITETEGTVSTHEIQNVLFNLVVRFHLNLQVINNSWSLFTTNSKFKYPFYLLLRSTMSDSLTMLYLIDAFNPDTLENRDPNAEFKKRYTQISHGYFQKVDSHLSEMIKQGEITAEERNLFFEEHYEEYVDHFESGNRRKIKRTISEMPVGAIYKFLQSTDFAPVAEIYRYYLLFSQYEHFGKKTEDLLLNDKFSELETILNVVDLLIISLQLNVHTMRIGKRYEQNLEAIHNLLTASFSEHFNRKT